MNKAEISEAFAIFRGAYPSASIFRGTAEEQAKELAFVISIWEVALADIDSYYGRLAIKRIVQRNKFFPSPAEFREAAEEIKKEMDDEIVGAFHDLKNAIILCEALNMPIAQGIRTLPRRTQIVIDAMGGIDKLMNSERTIDYTGFIRIYSDKLKSNPVMLTAAQGG